MRFFLPVNAMRQRTVALLLLFLFVGAASCSRDRGSPTAPSGADTPTLEHQTYTGVNNFRASRGLPALTWSEVIATQARLHSQNMASGATPFGHDGFEQRIAIIRQTIPWSSAAENVALDYSASGAVDAWLNSASHRANIEGDYDLTGVGTAAGRNGSIYFTQIFIKAR